jgi:hypothetical protein
MSVQITLVKAKDATGERALSMVESFLLEAQTNDEKTVEHGIVGLPTVKQQSLQMLEEIKGLLDAEINPVTVSDASDDDEDMS